MRIPHLWFASAAALGLAAFTVAVLSIANRESLWIDELHTSWAANASSWRKIAQRAAAAGNQTPAYFWFIACLQQTLGGPADSRAEWIVRLPSMIAWFVSAALVAAAVVAARPEVQHRSCDWFYVHRWHLGLDRVRSTALVLRHRSPTLRAATTHYVRRLVFDRRSESQPIVAACRMVSSSHRQRPSAPDRRTARRLPVAGRLRADLATLAERNRRLPRTSSCTREAIAIRAHRLGLCCSGSRHRLLASSQCRFPSLATSYTMGNFCERRISRQCHQDVSSCPNRRLNCCRTGDRSHCFRKTCEAD